jgi:S-adenosylmethionine hydrolase
MTIITLTTDFGERDGYVGVMKGVIWGIAPQVQFADLTHLVTPQNITEGALVLGRSWRYFPAGTIHLAIVDPGVGTNRRALAARIGEHFFVGPDNGLVTPLVMDARNLGWPVSFFHLNKPQFWLPNPSSVFHGRDIFSPIVAHLANSTPLDQLGDKVDNPVLFSLSQPHRTAEGWDTTVIQVDHFGDLATNLTPDHLRDMEVMEIQVGGEVVHRLVGTFAEAHPGELVALFDSSNHLSLCEANGSAAVRLGAVVGTPVRVILKKGRKK